MPRLTTKYIDTSLIEYHPSEDGCMDDTITRYDINEMPDADVVPRADYDKVVRENEELKRRLGAAISDMKSMALAMRESDDLSEGCCFACICDGQNIPDNCILPYGECPGYETNDCFEWRDAQGQSSCKASGFGGKKGMTK